MLFSGALQRLDFGFVAVSVVVSFGCVFVRGVLPTLVICSSSSV